MATKRHRTRAFSRPLNGGESLTILFSARLGVALPITAPEVLWLTMVNALAMAVPLVTDAGMGWVIRCLPCLPMVPVT